MSAREAWTIIVDVVNSGKQPDFVERRDRVRQQLSASHRRKGWIEAPYTVTVWDEFQTYTHSPESLSHLLWELRRRFVPWSLRIGVGTGEVEVWKPGRINERVGGVGFERARGAIDALKASVDDAGVRAASKDKFLRLTRFQSEDAERDKVLNAIYGMFDSMFAAISTKQWETIDAAGSSETLEDAARRLGVANSTVTRSLQRSNYWQLVEVRDGVTTLLSGWR